MTSRLPWRKWEVKLDIRIKRISFLIQYISLNNIAPVSEETAEDAEKKVKKAKKVKKVVDTTVPATTETPVVIETSVPSTEAPIDPVAAARDALLKRATVVKAK